MKAIVQRVRDAEVEVDSRVIGHIDLGLRVYVGVGVKDTAQNASQLADKIAGLRIFEDDEGKLNLSVGDVKGGILAIPNFTLMADARKGRRPAFVEAAEPDAAEPLYKEFISSLKQQGCEVAAGQFGSHMIIRSSAEGPVNILLDMSSTPEDVR